MTKKGGQEIPDLTLDSTRPLSLQGLCTDSRLLIDFEEVREG